jgi:hypothetical protein
MANGRRTHVVMARFNDEELKRLDALRGLFAMGRAKYMRARVLDDKLPKTTIVPELNREAWVKLSRSASNLNQIAHHLNKLGPDLLDIPSITEALKDFRMALIGAMVFKGDREER